MEKIFVIASGGALGAIARYLLASWLSTRMPMWFPIGTVVVNLTGSFVVGSFMALADNRAGLNPNWRLFVAVGFLGAYTTFSAFEYETFKLIEAGHFLSAAMNVILSVILGFISVALGVVMTRKLFVSSDALASIQSIFK